ncbi:hypothetical protein [Pseudonocardia humida]|nr:hypothetical protein [Pseudonocardia humida]
MLIAVVIVGLVLLVVLAVLVGVESRRRGEIRSGAGWHNDEERLD